MSRILFQGDAVEHEGERWHVQDVDRIAMLVKIAQFDEFGIERKEKTKWVRDELVQFVRPDNERD